MNERERITLIKLPARMNNSHFTLIELLIVISIIAILASLLLPALNKAREMSKEIVCASNFKQIYLIQETYSNDYNNFYNPVYFLDGGDTGVTGKSYMYWYDFLQRWYVMGGKGGEHPVCGF